ncbi:MAG: hypothetical protein ACMXYL_02520 [Candidatus Woesearchaeota archaeon]
MGMFVHNQDRIRVPKLNTNDNDNSLETLIENLRGLDYARRRAIPNIHRYVIVPFEHSLISNAIAEAGMRDSNDISSLKAKHTTRLDPGIRIMADTTVYPNTIVQYKRVLDRFSGYLEGIIAEKNNNIRRDMVRRKDNEVYIEASHAHKMLQYYHDAHAIKDLGSLIIIRNSDTGRKIIPPKIDDITIIMDDGHNGMLSQDNLEQYYDSLGMIESLRDYMQDYKRHYMKRNNIRADQMKSSVQKDYPLSKGGIIRMLFYPRRTIDYRSAYHNIGGSPAKKMVPDTGDIDIISTINPSMTRYYHERGDSKLSVEYDNNTVRIVRQRKKQEPVTTEYGLIINNDRPYISISQLLSRIDNSIRKYTKVNVRMNVNPIMPLPKIWE